MRLTFFAIKPYVLIRLYSFIDLIRAKIASFCFGVKYFHSSKSSFSSGVISIISFSAKNCDKVILNPSQIAFSVKKDGEVPLLNILVSVSSDRPLSFDNL